MQYYEMIGWFFATLGALASLFGILQFFFPSLGLNVLHFFASRRNSVSYYRRWKFHRIESAIEDARYITILQTWFPNLNSEVAVWERAKGAKFRILILDNSLTSNRLNCRDHDGDLIDQNISRIKKLNMDITLKKYLALPFGPVYIIDNTIFWGIFTSDSCSMDGPMFITRKGTWLGLKIEQSILSIWNRSETIFKSGED